jgi:hypothetical protein
MHNAERPIGASAAKGAPGGGGFGEGNLLYAAEENIVDCSSGAGEFVISSLKGALDTDATGELETVGTWGPKGKDGEGAGSCSAHWFTMRDGIVAEGFYAQGTRFIDVRDPKTPVQVAFFRPDEGVAWAAYFHGDYVYVADNARGVDILRLKSAASAAPLVSAPASATPAGCAGARASIAATGLKLGRRSALLRGTASAPACRRIGRVQVALAKASGGKCSFLGARGKLGKAGSCEAPVWLKARGTAKWSAALRGKLAKGSYFAFARAIGADGKAGDFERGRLVAGKGGRAKLVREVSAPSRG